LKAYLIYLNIEFKQVHDLGYLLNLIGTKVDLLEQYYDQVDKISRYAIQIRYPDAIIKLTGSQIKEAIDLSDLLLNLIRGKII
jgi:HEPN domain-containing protein